MDTQLLEQQLQGLQAKLIELRQGEALFHKASGLEQEAEKARQEAEEKEIELQAAKEDLAELRNQKARAMGATAEALSTAMSAVLPEGKAIFEVSEEGAVFIGWEKPDGSRVPYAGLSGGQQVPFDSALSFALMGKGSKVLIMELAELDQEHLRVTLEHLQNLPSDVQVIAMTCHSKVAVAGPWNVVEVK
jgi:uncharacterized protein YhaN